ncbi:bifunctional adenosylcobinamide kinase/adenosylcobinamide-phosphate guanylyltransferase [Undibacterium sp.]|uniref:bifunctional adenosylcobinamide kinase/adenosylcobinamide-phosphate guanylyltransferase n=1 Tax=Undibacterium sp. TaxID=1914977 RepID=UPI0037506293
MSANLSIARTELILGGQKSGKSARAEMLALSWLQAHDDHRAIFIATAQAWDDEMQTRIARHQADRALRLPSMRTIEEPLAVAAVIRAHSQPDSLIVLDCVTLWLTNWLMPLDQKPVNLNAIELAIAELIDAVQNAQGPVVIVSNEIGLGVIPMGREVRAYVDHLGKLNQALAAAVERVSLMVAGMQLSLKDKER